MEITSGVAQGSNLGLGLWNTFYESLLSLLRFDIPEESGPVGYEDVVAALIAGRTVEHAQSKLGVLMRRISGWLTAHLALKKTEVVILTRRRIPTLRPISIGELTVESKPAVVV